MNSGYSQTYSFHWYCLGPPIMGSQDTLRKGPQKPLRLTWHDSRNRQGNWRMQNNYSLAQIERYLQQLAAPWITSPNQWEYKQNPARHKGRELLQVSSLHKQDVLHSTKGTWLQKADLGDPCWQQIKTASLWCEKTKSERDLWDLPGTICLTQDEYSGELSRLT